MRKDIVIVVFIFTTFISLTKSMCNTPSNAPLFSPPNYTVEKSKGLFRYDVPLLSISSGNYTLPISLQYVAKGVKFTDNPGIVGLNWNLNAGGVVIRTVRGIADEQYDPKEKRYRGFLYRGTKLPADVAASSIDSVHLGRMDGELDLFTAMINDDAINFFIRFEDDKVVAKQLSQSSYKIECISKNSSGIISLSGWTITDGCGNRYIFTAKELSTPTIVNRAYPFNAPQNTEYPSSWMLDRIELPNSEKITFHYSSQDNFTFENNSINGTSYSYGKPIQYPNVLVDPDTFTRLISEFYSAAQWEGEMAIQRSYYGFRTTIMDLELRSAGRAILGALQDTNFGWNIYYDIGRTVDNVIYGIRTSGAGYFLLERTMNTATNLTIFLNTSLRQRIYKAKSSSLDSISVVTKTPVLTEIRTSRNTVKFGYDLNRQKLRTIELYDFRPRILDKVVIQTDSVLKKVIRQDRGGNTYQTESYDYYPVVGKTNLGAEYHGTKETAYSLKTIILPTNGHIDLEYESNTRRNSSGQLEEFSGLRIKSIVYSDGLGRKDRRSYEYPHGGQIVYDSIVKKTIINYADFADTVRHRLPQYYGNTFLNHGNHGLYYPYVEETLQDAGKKTYLYYIPPYNKKIWPYWLCELPLADASYDSQGRLISVNSYGYYIPLENYPTQFTEHFSQVPDFLGNNGFIAQLIPNPYYIDPQWRLKPEFTGGVQFSGLYINFGEQVNIFDVNFAKRVIPISDPRMRSFYSLFYGGKTVLRDMACYNFQNTSIVGPSIEHLIDPSILGQGVRTRFTEFEYTNSKNNGKPTAVINTLSSGARYIKMHHTIEDLQDNSFAAMADMSTNNVNDVPIKEIDLYQKEENSPRYLLCEKVTPRAGVTVDNTHVFLPITERVYTPKPDGELPVYSDVPGNNPLYSLGQDKYNLFSDTGYQQYDHYLPVTQKTRADEKVYIYDAGNENIILKTFNIPISNIAALDIFRVSELNAVEQTYCRANPTRLKLSGLDRNTLSVTTSVGCSKYRAYLYTKPTGLSVSVGVKINTGSAPTLTKTVVAGKWQLIVWDISIPDDIKGQVNRIELNLDTQNGIVAFAALAPESSMFEAYSYYIDGNIFCTIDQSGLVTRNEYDNAGRLVRTYDKDDNICTEHEYVL